MTSLREYSSRSRCPVVVGVGVSPGSQERQNGIASPVREVAVPSHQSAEDTSDIEPMKWTSLPSPHTTETPQCLETLHCAQPARNCKMNFYPPPPVIEAKLFLQIPAQLRCIDKHTEWKSGLSGTFKHIFLEGPVADTQGNLFVVDIPYGRILRIDTTDKSVTVAGEWDGEPNGLALRQDGTFVVADYKQVSLWRPLTADGLFAVTED